MHPQAPEDCIADQKDIEALALSGDPNAKIHLATLLQINWPNGSQNERIENLLLEAVSLNGHDCDWHLARFYVFTNNEIALDVIDKMMSKNDYLAYFLLGWIYEDGICGRKKDFVVAKEFFEKAYLLGHTVSGIKKYRLKIIANPLNIINYIKMSKIGLKFIILNIRDNRSQKLFY